MKRILFISVLALMTTAIFAQYDCDKYHKYNCPRSPDKKFSLNGQSKSAMVQIGVATKLNVIVYRGQDYRISFCSEKKIVGEKVHFQILQKERVPKDEEKLETSYEDILDENGEPTGEIREITNTVVDRTYVNELKVLYDNTQDDLSQEVEFSITSTKRLIIQVIAPGAEHVKMKRGSKQMDIGCVGILIEHMSSPGLGFE